MKIIDAKFRSNVVFSYGSQAVKLGLGFIWMTLVIQSLGLAVYGATILLTSLSGMVAALLTFRTNEAVIQYYRLGRETGDLGLAKLALLAGSGLDLLGATVLLVGVHLYSDLIASILLKDVSLGDAVRLYSWVMALTFVRGGGIGLLAAGDRFKVINSLVVLEQFLKLGLLVILIWRQVDMALSTIVAIILIATCVTSAAIIAFVAAELIRLRHVEMERSALRRYLRFTGSTFVSSTLKAGTQNIDNILLGAFTTPASVGIYSLIKQFLSPLLILVGPFNDQVYPRFVSAFSQRNFAEIRATITGTSRKILLWSLALLPGIMAITAGYAAYAGLPFSFENIATFLIVTATTLLLQQMWWTRGLSLSVDPDISIHANILYSLLMLVGISGLAWLAGMAGGAGGALLAVVAMTIYWRRIFLRHAFAGASGR